MRPVRGVELTERAHISEDHTRQVAEVAATYSASAEAYDRLWSPVIRPMAQPLLATLPLRAAKRILDVGTGSGGLIADIRANAPYAAIVGVDRSEGMLRVALTAAAASG